MLFHLLVTYVIFKLRNVKYQFNTKYPNNHYVKLTLEYMLKIQ